MAVKVSDSTGETWLSAFNDEAEKIIGCTADDLNDLKSEVRKLKTYISTGTQSLFSMF
jgi:replication factor A1